VSFGCRHLPTAGAAVQTLFVWTLPSPTSCSKIVAKLLSLGSILYFSLSYFSLPFHSSPTPSKPLYSQSSIVALPFHPLMLNSGCSALGSVCWSGSSGGHGVDGASGLGHVIVSLGADHGFWSSPNENCTFCAGSHDKLLVRGDCDLEVKNK
jgi:hypothetical protein